MGRLVLIALIVVAFGLRVQVMRPPDAPDLRAAAERLLVEQSATLLANEQVGVRGQALWFRLPGCPEPILAAPFHIALNLGSYTELHQVQDHALRVLYFDRVWTEQAKLPLLLTLIEQKLRSALGATPYRPTQNALLLAAPPACAPLLDIDLSEAWT